MKNESRWGGRAVVLSALLGATMLAGCKDSADGKPWAVRETCIKGVVYYHSGYQLAVALKQDGTPYLCQGSAP